MYARRGMVLTALVAIAAALAAQAESPLLDLAHETAVGPDKEDVTRGNRVLIVDDGYDALLLRVHLIRSAQRSIDIQTLILENDECGRLIMYELIQAAKRGVEVRLITDYAMSAKDRQWVAFLSTADTNLSLKYYRPPADFIKPPKLVWLANSVLFFRGTNQRMHNKVMIFDDALVITGGRNIDNHYYNHSTSYNFIDRDAVVVGPLVSTVKESFEDYWAYRHSVRSNDLLDVSVVIANGSFDRFETREDFAFNGFFQEMDGEANDAELMRERFASQFMRAKRVEFLADRPGKNRGFALWGGGKATRHIRKVMGGAEESLVVQSPYLILNYRGRRVFRKLRRHHPEAQVTVITNSFAATDNTLAYSANFKLRSNYIERLGWYIYEYKPHPGNLLEVLTNYEDLKRRAQEAGAKRDPFSSIHAKSFVRDDRIAYIGSYNIDPRSDNLNTEVGLLIEDRAVARRLKKTMLGTTLPDRSWVIAKREMPLSEVNYLLEGLSGLTPVDIWPLRNTTSFELIDGKEPVPPDHEDFYNRYTDAGYFPGAEGLSTKEIVTHLYKMLNTLAIPML